MLISKEGWLCPSIQCDKGIHPAKIGSSRSESDIIGEIGGVVVEIPKLLNDSLGGRAAVPGAPSVCCQSKTGPMGGLRLCRAQVPA